MECHAAKEARELEAREFSIQLLGQIIQEKEKCAQPRAAEARYYLGISNWDFTAARKEYLADI